MNAIVAHETAAEPKLELRQFLLSGQEPFDLTVYSGELVALTGWHASAVLLAVAGLADEPSGTVLVDGRPVGAPARRETVGIVLIPRGGALAPMLTGYENVLLPLLDRRPGSPRADAVSAPVEARKALASLGLQDSVEHLVEELSGGQQQRVAIARALAVQPRILLADHVTTDLDAGNRGRVLALLREHAAGDAAVLIATDDASVVETCDRHVSTIDPTP